MRSRPGGEVLSRLIRMSTAVVLLVLVLAQGPRCRGAPRPRRLQRIRKALAEAPAIDVPPSRRDEGPVFRVTVQGQRPVEPLWDNWSAVPTNIRPWFRSYHHEFLEQVTKEEFRSADVVPHRD